MKGFFSFVMAVTLFANGCTWKNIGPKIFFYDQVEFSSGVEVWLDQSGNDNAIIFFRRAGDYTIIFKPATDTTLVIEKSKNCNFTYSVSIKDIKGRALFINSYFPCREFRKVNTVIVEVYDNELGIGEWQILHPKPLP